MLSNKEKNTLLISNIIAIVIIIFDFKYFFKEIINSINSF